MRKIICCILSVFVSFLMVSPVYAENGNSVADHEPTEIVYINELEDTDSGIGSILMFSIVLHRFIRMFNNMLVIEEEHM